MSSSWEGERHEYQLVLVVQTSPDIINFGWSTLEDSLAALQSVSVSPGDHGFGRVHVEEEVVYLHLIGAVLHQVDAVVCQKHHLVVGIEPRIVEIRFDLPHLRDQGSFNLLVYLILEVADETNIIAIARAVIAIEDYHTSVVLVALAGDGNN